MRSLITTLTMIFLAMALAVGEVTITKDSLIAYYNFETNSDNQISNKYHLSGVSLASSTVPVFVAGGKLGNAVQFNGNNALLNSTEFALKMASATNKSLSISFWVSTTITNRTYPTFVEVFESLFLRKTVNPEFGIATSANNGTGTASWTTSNSSSIENTGWQHFALVFDAPNKKFTVYKNGSQLYSATTVQNHIHMTNQMFVVGAGTNSGEINYPVKGAPSTQIDEMYVYNRALSSREVTELAGLVAFPVNTVSDNKLLAYYPFENDYLNATSNNFHLTKTTSTNPTLIAGKKGNALNLNLQQALWNQNEYGQYFNSATEQSLSVSLWVNRIYLQTTNYNSVFEFFESMYLRQNMIYGIATSPTNWLETTSVIANDSWQHIVTVYDDNLDQTRLYVNGLLKGTQNNVNLLHKFHQAFSLGVGTVNSAINANSKGFIGKIDEVYVFNRALTGSEISGLTNLAPVENTVSSLLNSTDYKMLNVYPNPARTNVRVSSATQIDRVELYSLSGSMIQSVHADKQNEVLLNITNTKTGIYILKSYTSNDVVTTKLEVQ